MARPPRRNGGRVQPRNAAQAAAPTGVASAYGRARTQNAPRVAMSGDGQRCVVSHREYIAEVSGSTAFASTSYTCQPALQTMFEWLQPIAGNFEKYRFRKLAFEYETECATSQTGSIMYMFDYDVLDSAPTSKQVMAANKVYKRVPPWMEMVGPAKGSEKGAGNGGRLEVPVFDFQRDWYYTRAGAVPSGADQRLYDCGNLVVASQNASGAAGELYVVYEIELISPQPNTSPLSGRSAGTTSLTSAALFGADAAFASGSNIGWSLTNASTMTCTIAGDYIFVGKLVGTVLSASVFAQGGTATTTAGGVAYNDSGALNVVGFLCLRAQVGQTFVPSITSATTVTSAQWRIATYNGTLLT